MDVGTAAFNTISAWRQKSKGVITGITSPAAPERDPEARSAAHALWMLGEVMANDRDWKDDKLNRWLGYAQGLLVLRGALNLEDVKRCNKDV